MTQVMAASRASDLIQGLVRVSRLVWLGVRADGVAVWQVGSSHQFLVSVHASADPERPIFRLRLVSSTASSGADYQLIPGVSPASPVSVEPIPAGWRLRSGQTELDVTTEPFQLTLRFQGIALLTSIRDLHFRGWSRIPELAFAADRQLIAFELAEEEAVYGLGEKFSALNRRGQLVIGRNEDALGVNAERSYKNIPFAWSPRGWGLLVHTPAVVTHGVGYAPWSHRAYVLDIADRELDMFLFAASEPARIIADYHELTGHPEPVPFWSLGTWISRAYYRTPEEALAVATTWRAQHLPGDVLTLDGRACWDVATRFSFQWDASRFPDPAATLAQLKALGFRLCVWEYPLVSVDGPLFQDLAAKGWLLQTRAGTPYRYDWKEPSDTDASAFGDILTPLPVSGIVDLTHPEAYAWWRDQHAELFAIGVDVIKADFGEQVPDDAVAWNGDSGARLHNVYALLYHRCVYDATQRAQGQDTLIWARDGFIGSQRYPIQWGGDPQSDWGGLAASLRGMLGYGLSGVPYYSSDIGGFYGAEQSPSHLSPDLYLRWLALGVYSSHCRLHGLSPREPWFFDPETQRMARELLGWRYRLLPYLQSVIENSVLTGLPVACAMPLAFPHDSIARHFEHQYLFGPALLVCPVIAPVSQVSVWLPAGSRWFDLWSEHVYEGGQLLELTTRPGQIPVFGREGHVLPLGPVVASTDAIHRQQPLNELWLFGATTNVPRMYAPDNPIPLITLIQPGHVQIPAGLTLRTWGARWNVHGNHLSFQENSPYDPV